jgi:hypothetical protein
VTMCGDVRVMAKPRWSFLLLALFSLIPLKILFSHVKFQSYSFIFWGVEFNHYSFDFYFFLGYFIKFGFVFNLIIQSQIVIYLFFNLIFILLIVL